MSDFVVVRTDFLVNKGVHTGDTGIYATEYDNLNKITNCRGAGSPPSGTAGYQVGCRYTNLTTGAQYFNAGSITACNFVGGAIIPDTTNGLLYGLT